MNSPFEMKTRPSRRGARLTRAAGHKCRLTVYMWSDGLAGAVGIGKHVLDVEASGWGSLPGCNMLTGMATRVWHDDGRR